MAQLPPKVPSILPHQDLPQQQQWQEFIHAHHHQEQGQNPPWVDEFIEFSAARRGAHRRTMSDSSVAFVEAGPTPFASGPFRPPPDITETPSKNRNEDEFDKFDDEQFMSMFSTELAGRSTSNPSSTSDHNSTNEDQERRSMTRGVEGGRCSTSRVKDGEKAEEVESSCKFEKDQGKMQAQGQGEGSRNKQERAEAAAGCANNNTSGGDQQGQQSKADPKRVKRILANRQSAQRSRVRKLQYISELERSVTALQSEVSVLSPRVAFLDHQRMILNVDNSSLKAKIAALAQDKIFKDAHQEAMKREIERLRQVYYQQNLNKTENIIPPPLSSSLPPTTTQLPPPNTTVHDNEQLTG